jgi:hypothetical protein
MHEQRRALDTSGDPPLLAWKASRQHRLSVKFTDKPRAEFEVKNFPPPERYGTYATILLRGENANF